MKRLFIVASLAIMAVGCQKTTVENEVLTPIGFNTEVGKQTRAIIEGTTYADTSNFGVYSYAKNGATTLNKVMNDETISKRVTSEEGAQTTTYAWKAATPYYWPNDASTTLDFYAYSPKGINAKMETEGTLTLANYTHENYQGEDAIDFMTAVPAKGQTYSSNATNKGVVPVEFHHQMTQVQFVVKSNLTNANVTFSLVSITLNNVVNQANYSNAYTTNYGTWTKVATGSYTIFNKAEGVAIDAAGTNTTTTAATMIPQTLVASTTTAPEALNGSHFTVVYKISGTGVAHETVTKSIDLKAGSIVEWAANKKVIYTLTVGLNEITFEPTVADWDSNTVTSGDISIN